MSFVRYRHHLVAGFTLASLAALVSGAAAQDTPAVRYGTDPGHTPVGAPQYLSYQSNDAPAPTGELLHTVQGGETVYAIGRIYSVSPAAIIAKNQLSAPYALTIGQGIIIPMGGTSQVAAEQARFGEIAAPAVPTPRTTPQPAGNYGASSTHLVQPGDTLYSLSRRYGVSVQDIAAVNNMMTPYTLSVGQRVAIPGGTDLGGGFASPTTTTTEQRTLEAKMIEETVLPPTPADVDARSRFAWPLRGSVMTEFGDQIDGVRSDGINIAAPMGSPVRATADGEVVYRGSELDGYGNLLLIRHDGGWVSAYAHTDAILVRKGDFVRQGQVVAKVGRTGSVSSPQLHFQLRKNLQPQDPVLALQGGLAGSQSARLR
ncbi:MAG: LysM peptidoglycan-binding domain-containing M23 family metallopeptidase [Pseudomonadota bacterium]